MRRKLPRMVLSRRWYRAPSPAAAGPEPRGRKVTRFEAGRYIGCPACGRLLKIEWAVRSLVCSCGSRIPVTPDGKGT